MIHEVIALVTVVALALVFDVTNGFHDSANAVAALVATRAARPAQAVLLAAAFHVIGPLVAGTAVASTVGGIVRLSDQETVSVLGAAITAALAWNLLTWWRGLPSSSSHALVGGLVGAALVSSGVHAVRWGGFDGAHPVGVIGVIGILAISPLLGFVAGALGARGARRVLRRASKSIDRPIRRLEWVTAASLALSHGANDAQKTMGVITLLLVATGHLAVFSVPLWVKLSCAGALTIGTAMGGWRIVRTIGSQIYKIRPIDGLVSQAGSAAVIMSSAVLGGPVSTTHVVASSIVGVGAAHGRRRVRWRVAGEMAAAWLVTLPAAALIAAATLPLWRWFT